MIDSWADSEHQKKLRLEEFRKILRQKGMPLTFQRRVILETLLDLRSHPPAEEIYSSRAVRKARISRATVYRTLEALVEMGLITKIGREGGAVRYDGRVQLHHHLVCQKCGAVMDFMSEDLSAVSIPDTSELGFVVTGLQVQLRGFCSHCRSAEEKSRAKKESLHG